MGRDEVNILNQLKKGQGETNERLDRLARAIQELTKQLDGMGVQSKQGTT